MAGRSAHYLNYQQRATEFAVGDKVFPFQFATEYESGRVVDVFPAIGIVEVAYPNGTKRTPVEELQRIRTEVEAPETEDVPGGAQTVSVPGGPPSKVASQRRVAEAFVKKSLYWAARNRQYRARRDEINGGSYTCPKCKAGILQNAAYKRSDGVSDKLFGCNNCLFLIKKIDIIGHPNYQERKPDPLARMRVPRNAGEVG